MPSDGEEAPEEDPCGFQFSDISLAATFPDAFTAATRDIDEMQGAPPQRVIDRLYVSGV